MKKIEAFLKPFRLDDVKKSLLDAGISGMTISEVHGFGQQQGHHEVYRGLEYQVDFIPKVMIMVLVEDDQVETFVSIIKESAHTGKLGDGKIVVTPVDQVVRIRTGEENDSAV